MTENIIYKVGNMNTLGFEPSELNNPRSDKVDSYGITWFEAVIGCTSMMFTHDPQPKSLSALWIGDVLYQYDDKQLSKEVRDLIYASTLDDPKPEILDLVEVVSEYAIPINGTEWRFMFSAFTKSIWADITRKNDRAEKIRQKIQEIAEINRL